MAFSPTKHTKDVLMWMLSTKMLPPVGVLVPIYLIFRDLGLLDSRIGLTVVLTLINLPIIIWMLYTYFREIPGEILEAARMDGANVWTEFRHVVLPLAVGGLFSTGLLCLVLAWNESFWSLNLSSANGGTLATMIAFVVGYVIIGWFLKFVSTRSYRLFVWYRIFLGMALYLLLGFNVISA